MCIFCEIAKKNIPSRIVYEDDKTLAFLDLSPINSGHTLIIPKKHFDNFFDLDEETASSLSKTTLKVVHILKDKLGYRNLNIINNSGEISGQTVMHVHIHVIPRVENDSLKIEFGKNEEANNDLDKTLDIIKKA